MTLAPTTLILSAGGLRSLVATASVLSTEHRPDVILLYLHDGRISAKSRLAYVHRQAHHFSITNVIGLHLPHLNPTAKPDRDHDLPKQPVLVGPQVLLTGVAQAIQHGATRLIWPAQSNADFPIAGRLAEQIILIEHLAQLQQPDHPRVQTPLLELSDQQLIELGGQMGVPWELAWSCSLKGPDPCRVCADCRRRHEAFNGAGIIDPIDQVAVAR